MLDDRRYFKIRVKYHVIMVYYFCMRSLLTYCYSTKEILGRDFDKLCWNTELIGASLWEVAPKDICQPPVVQTRLGTTCSSFTFMATCGLA